MFVAGIMSNLTKNYTVYVKVHRYHDFEINSSAISIPIQIVRHPVCSIFLNGAISKSTMNHALYQYLVIINDERSLKYNIISRFKKINK